MFALLLLAILYSLDLISIAIRRSTLRVRRLHHWIEKVPSLDEENPNADISTKSYQYLPNYKVFIGSLPRHASVLSMILMFKYYPDLDFMYQLGIGLSLFFSVDYLLSSALRYYCLSIYSNTNKSIKVENKSQ